MAVEIDDVRYEEDWNIVLKTAGETARLHRMFYCLYDILLIKFSYIFILALLLLHDYVIRTWAPPAPQV